LQLKYEHLQKKLAGLKEEIPQRKSEVEKLRDKKAEIKSTVVQRKKEAGRKDLPLFKL